MPALDENARLWKAAARGDREAFAALFDAHAPALYRFASRLLGPGADAEDAVQNVLVAVLERRAYKPARGPLRGYLLGAVRNQARKLRRMRTCELDSEMPSDAIAPDDRAAAVEAGHAAAAAITALPWTQREVFLLAHDEGLSLKGIAEALDLDLAAVKSRLHRAREALREQLEPFAPSPKGGDRS